MEIRTEILMGDAKEELKKLSDNSVDLIVTSPPYADQRKSTYAGRFRGMKTLKPPMLSNKCHPNPSAAGSPPHLISAFMQNESLSFLQPKASEINNMKRSVFKVLDLYLL